MLRCKVNDRVDDAVLHQATGILLDVDAWIDDSPGLAKFFTHFIGSDWQAMKEGEGKSKGRFKNIRCGGKSVAREVAERNRFILRQFAEQAFEPLRVRLARVILILAESYGSECNDGVVVNLRLAKDKLGEMLSVSRQSVTKEIKPLETEGVIRMNYGRILILDMEALRAIARAD